MEEINVHMNRNPKPASNEINYWAPNSFPLLLLSTAPISNEDKDKSIETTGIPRL